MWDKLTDETISGLFVGLTIGLISGLVIIDAMKGFV